MNQSDIIKGCKQGQEKAFKALTDQYAPKLMAICMRYLKDHDQAKDALQESMISIFRSINSFSGAGSFEGWLSKIVVHACIKEIKNQKQFFDLNIVDLQEVKDYEDPSSFATEDLMKLINELPEIQRVVFNMFVVEGLNHAEIGSLLGIPESSSRVYLTRARRWLQGRIEGSNLKESTILKYKS